MQPELRGPTNVPVNISLKGVKRVGKLLQLKVEPVELLRVVLANQ